MKHYKYTNKDGKVLILKVVGKYNDAHRNFIYPQSGIVKPWRWDKSPVCGDGLHGWAWGFGIGEGKTIDLRHNKWIVLAAKPEDVVGNLENTLKVKCREAEVVYNGSFEEAWKVINHGYYDILDGYNNMLLSRYRPLSSKHVSGEKIDIYYPFSCYEHQSFYNDITKNTIFNAHNNSSIMNKGAWCNIINASNNSNVINISSDSDTLIIGNNNTIFLKGNRQYIKVVGKNNLLTISGKTKAKVVNNDILNPNKWYSINGLY